MIKDEKPILSKLAPEIQETIPLVINHVLKIDEIHQIHKRDQEKLSETKKKRKTRVELLEMVETYYASKVVELNCAIEATLEKELKQFPPLTPC